ncbi:ZDHHC2 [Symbiodinium sp. CCMP2592]|nr:ZDHHC2 [Symbiodinium sp. CCMP2592]
MENKQDLQDVREQLVVLQSLAHRTAIGAFPAYWAQVNLLSLGIPTIVWGDARGNLDVLEGRWPPGDLFGDGSEFGTLPLQYPPELVIRGDGDALGALRLVLQNATLRALAREQGLQLAQRFTLQKIASRLARILRLLLRRRLARKRWHFARRSR